MIRQLAPGEGAIWRAIRLEALATAPKAFSSRHADWVDRPVADFEARIAGAAVFVAELGGETVGCAVLSPDTDPAEAGRGWVESVFVRPARRGLGVGDALIEALIAEARARGLAEVLLDVGDANAKARALYLRAGFLPMAERPAGSASACEITLRLDL